MTSLTTLLLIRHGEKPVKGCQGVDEQGKANPDGLIPRGWQRAGGLAALFAPNGTTLRSTFPTPGALVSPRYSDLVHRPYLTLIPLSEKLNITITTDHEVDDHPARIAKSLLTADAAVVLVCWEHEHLVGIAGAVAAAVRMANPADVPVDWPGNRFDVIWRFGLDVQTSTWTFSSLDQQLLAGDLFPA